MIARTAATLAVLVLGWLILGFVVLPEIAQHQLVGWLGERLERPVEIGDVSFDPFSLRLEVAGLVVPDEAGLPLLELDRLSFDVELVSLLERAWVLDDIEIFRPSLQVRIDEEGGSELQQLFVALQSDPTPQAADRQATASGTAPFSLRHATIVEGRVAFIDEELPADLSVSFAPIELEVQNLDSRSAQSGHFAFSTTEDGGGRLSVSGDLSLLPLRAEGRLALTDFRLATFFEYARGALAIEPPQGTLAIDLRYRVDLDGEPERSTGEPTLAIAVSNAELRLNDLRITAEGAARPTLSAAVVAVRELAGSLDERRATIGSLRIDGAHLAVAREADGRLDLARLVREAPPGSPRAGASTEPGTPPFGLKIAELRLAGLALALEDRTLQPSAQLLVEPLDLALHGFDTSESGDITLELTATLRAERAGAAGAEGAASGGRAAAAGDAPADPSASEAATGRGTPGRPAAPEAGRIVIRGEGSLSPLALQLDVEASDVSLPLMSPHLASHTGTGLRTGTLGLAGQLVLSLPEPGAAHAGPALRYRGTLSSDDLDLRGPDGRRMLSFRHLALDEIGLDIRPTRLSVGEVRLDGARLVHRIDADGASNIERAFELAGAEAPPSAAGERPQIPVRIERVRLRETSVAIRDAKFEPVFQMELDRIEASIDDISTSAGGRSKIRLEARIDGTAPVQVEGEVTPFDPQLEGELAVQATGIELPPLSPHSLRLLGYGIERGKLGIEGFYAARAGQLEATNRIHLDKFELGEERVAKSGKALPLPLAIALLRDRRGRITLDVPLRGNANDPDFSFTGLLGKALRQSIQKTASSPFSALAAVVGRDVEDLNEISYRFGSTELDAAAREKLAIVAQALTARPGLELEIAGSAERGGDGDALARMMLWQHIEGAPLLGYDDAVRSESLRDAAIREGRYASAILAAYRARFSANPDDPAQVGAEEQPATSAGSRPEGPDAATDAPANAGMLEAAERRLASEFVPPEAELRRLARDRARSIWNELVDEYGLEAGRLYARKATLLVDDRDDHAVVELRLRER